MRRSLFVLMGLVAACGNQAQSRLSMPVPARLAQSSVVFANLVGTLQIYSALGQSSFPQNTTPVAQATIPLGAGPKDIYVKLGVGSYYAEAKYTDQEPGWPGALPLLRQFTATTFEVKAHATATVDLTVNQDTSFDSDGDGMENLAEMEAATDPTNSQSFACAPGSCIPTLFAANVANPAALAVDDIALYFFQANDQTVYRIDKASGSITPISTNGYRVAKIETSHNRLMWSGTYWDNPTALEIAIIDSTEQQPPQYFPYSQTSDISLPATAALGVTGVDYVDQQTSPVAGYFLNGFALPSGTPFSVGPLTADTNRPPVLIAHNDANIYWEYASVMNPGIATLPMDGHLSTPTVILASSSATVAAIAVNDTTFYWTEDTSIHSATLDLASPQLLFSDTAATSILDLYVTNDAVYWVRTAMATSAHELVGLHTTGGPPPATAQTLWSDASQELRILASDGIRVYWWSPSTGNVMSFGLFVGH